MNAGVAEKPKRDAQGALIFWKAEAQRLKARVRELERMLGNESAGRLHDTRILYRAAETYADASRTALKRVGVPPYDETIRLAHGGTMTEFSAWWIALGAYVNGEN